MSKSGFVALSSLKQQGPPSAEQSLAEIRRIYFTTTARTIDHDFAHAIELLKGLDGEVCARSVGVHGGLAELRRNGSRARSRRGKSRRGLAAADDDLLRAVTPSTSVTLRSWTACEVLVVEARQLFIDNATGVFGFFTPASATA